MVTTALRLMAVGADTRGGCRPLGLSRLIRPQTAVAASGAAMDDNKVLIAV